MKSLRWVIQEDPTGCVLASLAMVMGITYQEMKTKFPYFDKKRRDERKGVNWRYAEQFLNENGFGLISKRKTYMPQMEKRQEWPPAPWGTVHIAVVTASKGDKTTHMVVVDANGFVLDPAETPIGPYGETPYAKMLSRKLADYHIVHFVASIHQVLIEKAEAKSQEAA